MLMLASTEPLTSARRRTHMRFPDQDPEAITRLTKRLKIFDLYGQASCRYICQEILRSLPPELCDVIIENVIDHNDAIVKVNRICEPVYANTRGQSLEHHWKVEYVGRLMLARMMTVWYRNSNFVMHGTQYWREDWRDYSLRVFLNEEAPCIYLPRYRLITKISVTIHASSITVDRKQENRNWNGANSADLRPTWGQVVQGFEALFQLRSGSSIQIIVHGSERIGLGDDRLDDILATCTDPILESMSRLKRAGYILSTTLLVGQRSFGYSLCEPNSLDEDATHVPAGETGLIWRRVLAPDAVHP